MARFIYNQAENILRKLPGKDRRDNCPVYLTSIEYTMLTLKAILLDAAEKQEGDHALQNLLKGLQNVFYQIEDIIDEFKSEDPQGEGFKQEAGVGKKLPAPFLCSDQLAFKSRSARKMRNLCDHLDTMAATMYEFQLTERNEKYPAHTRMEMIHCFHSATEYSARLMKPGWQLVYPLTGTPVEYREGRYNSILEDFKKSDKNFYYLVGNVGTGKSTLAKFLYNDHDVVEKFKLRAWVCVQEDFDTRRLLQEILSFTILEEDLDDLTENQLFFKVKQYFRMETFLLVFQDLLSNNLDKPLFFQDLVKMGNQGSRILVTSQSDEVANATDRDKQIHKIERLSEDNSYSLFKENAFRDVQNTELEEIGKEIVKKCEGVPLTIKCLGGLMSSKTRTAEWKNVRDKLLAQEEKDLPAALRLCYDLMPSRLKRCFLLCSQLPNDRMFSSNDLIQLWMAHGLLHSPEGKNLSLENIGEKYFMELWTRCFFQDLEEHGLGYWFKMHPLIRKLACAVAQEQTECTTKPITEIRSIAFQVREKVPPSESLADKCISRFTHLRLLHLGNTNLQEIPNSIGKLKYLRYLDLQGNNKIKRLPDSICNLHSLQTLILASCSELEELPYDIRNLISLRYLWVTSNNLRLQKNGIGTLTSLRFLAIGGCGGDSLRNLFEKSECLETVETLMIYDCKLLKSLPEGMKNLKSLQNLVIWGCKNVRLSLEKVKFRLQRLTIRDLPKVEELPEWLEGSAETLRILDIINCPIVMDIEKIREMYDALERTSVCSIVRSPPHLGGGYVDKNILLRDKNFPNLKF